MLAAWALVAVLVLLALLQIALAAGAPLGRFAWGGQHEVLPTGLRVGSGLSLLVYVVMAVLVLDRAGAIDVVGDRIASVGVWVVVAFAGVSVAGNAASRSAAERAAMAPTSALLCALAVLVALG